MGLLSRLRGTSGTESRVEGATESAVAEDVEWSEMVRDVNRAVAEMAKADSVDMSRLRKTVAMRERNEKIREEIAHTEWEKLCDTGGVRRSERTVHDQAVLDWWLFVRSDVCPGQIERWHQCGSRRGFPASCQSWGRWRCPCERRRDGRQCCFTPAPKGEISDHDMENFLEVVRPRLLACGREPFVYTWFWEPERSEDYMERGLWVLSARSGEMRNGSGTRDVHFTFWRYRVDGKQHESMISVMRTISWEPGA
ncbi:uncharacterized protein B0I36DRAFT_316363 [Microdochium trichocladiopsis]|uniref:Uncharacterized protein n=1 Tax=Microdochium trichocladiopsis TaxID=1682393 RepID=A0A9P8YGG2_9PEZI|nr:uncharacterized protein B0I36DRAFT_316363 [Microdochium trichocladiopsis]KAH7038467.1 hypothetical protein B0I36DRAFT_316363 [Microdochium trichocladiopsis]